MHNFINRKKFLATVLFSLSVLLLLLFANIIFSRQGVAPINEFLKYIQPKPKELRLLAKDWQILSFRTTEDYKIGPDGGESGRTYPSSFHADTTYIIIEPNLLIGNRFTLGGFTANAENVNIRIFDVAELKTTPQFDSSAYSLNFLGTFGEYNLQNPTDLINNTFFEKIEVYNSELPENLELRIDQGDENDLLFWPSATIFSGTPGMFYSHFRPSSQYTYNRKFDIYSKLDNRLVVTESYKDWVEQIQPLEKSMSDENDKYSRVNYTVNRMQNETTGIIILSEALQIFINEKEVPTYKDRTYLVLLTTEKDLRVNITPTDYALHYSLNVFNPDLSYEGDLAKLNPISKEINISGAIGKISIGVDTIATDELSDMVFSISETPTKMTNITWQNQVTGDNLGQPSIQQFLGIESLADSVELNGQEMIPKYWDSFSPELKGAIIGGLIAFLGSFLNLLIERLKKTEPPIVNVTVPAPIVTIVQEQKSPSIPLFKAFKDLIQKVTKKHKNDGN